MRLWLDDIRDPKHYSPHYEWVWVKTAPATIKFLETGEVTHVSLDHDLGNEVGVGNGYGVAVWIEEAAYTGRIPRLQWAIHSANPVGAANMRKALENADRYWQGA